jgi:hypothetical protein
MYYPYGWPVGGLEEIDEFQIGRQKQVVALIRTGFLKRFESSTIAFDYSCQNLLLKLLAFAKRHSETPTEKRHLERWEGRNKEVLDYVKRQQAHWNEHEAEDDEDIVSDDQLEGIEKLDREKFQVSDGESVASVQH